jgi:hypothetical protein
MLNRVAEAPIHGSVAPGFEEVETEFRKNFRDQDELGAACAIYHDGEKVVDLWGATATSSVVNLGKKIP